jgi:hypothetical protein
MTAGPVLVASSEYRHYLVSGPGVPVGTQIALFVDAAPKTAQFKFPARVATGVPFAVILTIGGNGYNADVTLTGNQTQGYDFTIPNPIKVVRGAATFTMTVNSVPGGGLGTAKFTLDGPEVPPGSSFTEDVQRPPQFVQCTAPASVDAGVPFAVNLTFFDEAGPFGIQDTAYSTDITVSNPNDPNANIPSSIPIDHGAGQFTMSVGAIGSGVQTYTLLGPGVPAGTSFQVTVNPVAAPTLTSQPSNITVATGQDGTFWVTATGFPNYQWSLNGSPIPGATSPMYTVHSVGPGDVGSYTVEVANTMGFATSTPATLTLSAASGSAPVLSDLSAPIIETTPGRTVVLGAGGPSGSSTAGSSGSAAKAETVGSSKPSPRAAGSLSYQWFLNQVALIGQTNPTLVVSDVEPWSAGSYTCLVSNAYGSTFSTAQTVKITATQDPGRLVNLSTRSRVGTGAGQLIEGFVVGGDGTAGTQVLLNRVSGPALSQFGISDVLADPQLTITGDSSISISNSGWQGNSDVAGVAAQVGAFSWPDSSSLDSALINNLPSGAYTALISGANGDSGIALGEVYDATSPGAYSVSYPRLINISSRAEVGTGADILIAGFVVAGSTSETVLIRGSGPALIPFGVPGTLHDPQLRLFRTNSDGTSTLIQSNAGWNGNPQIASTSASVGAFSWGSASTSDSAILVTLPPGSYTAQVSGASGDTGIALVEVYEVP